MTGLAQDIRYALRQISKRPGFSTTVVFTLALAIGISTAAFSVIDAVLIRPLPYDHPERIFYLQSWSPQGYTQPASYPEYLDWRRETHVFSALAGLRSDGSANFEGPSGPVAIPRVMSTDNFFDVFRVAPYLGRTFSAGEDQPGNNDVVVLSYEVWQEYFGSQASAVGQTIKIDGTPYTIIGVMPAGFRYPINLRGAIYTPIHVPKEVAQQRGSHWLPTIARLKDGVSREQAQNDMDRVLASLAAQAFPDSKDRRMQFISIAAQIIWNTGGPLKVLISAVLAVLGIGCVNVAGLLLSNGVRRQREMALRSAVGAVRSRIVRQMLTETFLLALLGALGGALLAAGLLSATRTLLVAALARGAEVCLDTTALLVAIALAVLASLASGVGPALRLSATSPNLALKTGGAAGSSRTQHRLRSGFIVAQIALALVLLVTSGLLLRLLAGLRGTDLGFDPNHILTDAIVLSSTYQGRDTIATFYRPLEEKVKALPGVEAAGLIEDLPIETWGNNSDTHIVGHPPDPPNQERLAETRYVSPGYFNALGISTVRGRLLDEHLDTPDSLPVVVVNEAFVKKFFSAGEDPIGKYVEGWMGKIRIVGVVRSIRQDIYQPPMAEMDASISAIPPQYQSLVLSHMSLVVRTRVQPESIVPTLRRIFHELDPSLPFREPLTMRQVMADVLVLERLENWLFGAFAALAVLLSIVGLYGLISHEVELSTRDIGVRMALGATRVTVLSSLYRRVALMLAAGVLAGLLLTEAAQKLISAIVTIHAGKDLAVVAGLAAALFFAGIVAVLVPARRAMRVDPIVALRYE